MTDSNDDDLVPRSHIKELEDKAHRADELAAENEKLKKDVVFTSALAGVDHPGLGYFRDGYKGDLTPEAIRQAAMEAGFIQAGSGPTPAPPPTTPSSTPTSTPQPPDLAAQQRMAAAAVGSAPPPPFDPIEAIAKASNSEEVMAIVESHGEKYGVVSSRLIQ